MAFLLKKSFGRIVYSDSTNMDQYIFNGQCSGWHFGVDMDPRIHASDWFGSGFCYFRHWPSRRQLKTNYKKSFSAYYFWICIIIKDKKSKRSHKQEESRFFLLFLLDDRRMIEGSGSGSMMTNGSGFGRPRNMWIRWIRIRNTVNGWAYLSWGRNCDHLATANWAIKNVSKHPVCAVSGHPYASPPGTLADLKRSRSQNRQAVNTSYRKY
jgi:hypothetical protein